MLYTEIMNDTKMLQAILDGQRSMEERLSNKISEVRDDIQRVEAKVDENGRRLDMQGKQLAYLEDDAPTREEFDGLEKRVNKLERVKSSN